LREVEFQLAIQLLPRAGSIFFGVAASLTTQMNGTPRVATMELPETQDDSGVLLALRRQAESAFSKLAIDISRRTAS
jgi:hypothetical protein